jgi:hypothetical protein
VARNANIGECLRETADAAMGIFSGRNQPLVPPMMRSTAQLSATFTSAGRFKRNQRSIAPNEGPTAVEFGSLSDVLGRVAYPVEPFSFHFGPRDTLLSFLEGKSERLGNRPCLFGQPEDRQTDQLQYVHVVSGGPVLSD